MRAFFVCAPARLRGCAAAGAPAPLPCRTAFQLPTIAGIRIIAIEPRIQRARAPEAQIERTRAASAARTRSSINRACFRVYGLGFIF